MSRSPPSAEGYRWIVDPLDGTTNYVHGIPYWSVSIALAQHDQVVAAIVYQPTVNECFTATLGGGTFLNGARKSVSEITTLAEAVVAMSLPAGVGAEARELMEMGVLAVRTQSLRRMGSAAINLAYVAAGRFDAYWTGSTRIWDVAAGVLLVREAGGTICDGYNTGLPSGRMKFIAAANDALRAELQQTLAAANAGS
ncbi:MAG TPA: inositol monophosphatase family protein [Pirellulales bacterium]|nr:inositol monophosphatase family protein [Pirellulales bacterium]